MEHFSNATFQTFPLPQSTSEIPDMEKLRDIVTAGGSGRFFGGGYSPYYNGGYPMGPNMTSVADVVIGLVIIGIIVLVAYGILAFLIRLQQRFYYGVRKKRSATGNGDSEIDILLGGGSSVDNSNFESWRNAHPNLMRMMQSDATHENHGLHTTAKIVEAIEKKSLDYDFIE